MTVGFIVSFFDFRNDVRRVIAEVAKQHQVVIFGKAEHQNDILRHLPEGLEFRLIDERKNTRWNALWLKLYVLLKRIPKSRENFFLMEFFKASINTTPTVRAKNYQILKWVERLPKVISYDFYLRQLRYKSATNLEGIEQFVAFTAIADDFLMARLLHEKHPVKVYVYSWDHPCKHVCFSPRAQYLCWNEPLREDIVALQRIPAAQVKVLGASQFGYVAEFRAKQSQLPRTYDFDYVYLGCAIGVSELLIQEVAVVKIIAELLQKTKPSYKLVVRPYPVQDNWDLYEPIRQLPNVVMDEGFRTLDLSVKDGHILEKFEKIHHAKAFFHLGTTMGLEACFTQTPSFIIDFGYNDSRQTFSLYYFIHQYQNNRHLIELAPQNAVKSEEELKTIFENLEAQTYRQLNQKVQRQYNIKTFEEFAKALIS
jgi:hypothetical protein